MSTNNDMSILDLPDEILQFIFNKLKMVDMFYSLVDVNERFDRLTLDSLYIHHLDLAIEPLNNFNSSMSTHILERICEKILPRIKEKTSKLTLTPFSMEPVLGVGDYPQLHSLSFVNFRPKMLSRSLTDQTVLLQNTHTSSPSPTLCIRTDQTMLHLLTNQITHITVDSNMTEKEISDENESNLFELILLHSIHLKDLTFLYPQSHDKFPPLPSLNISNRNFLSSTLTKLTINVNTFDDCLYLLDSSLQSLSVFIIHIYRIADSSSMIDNTTKLLKLKSFSLSTDCYTSNYNKQVVPLLQRMLNLEELILFLLVGRTKSAYIDGDQLDNKVLQYMPRLNKFIFNIHTQVSTIYSRKKIHLQSNNDLRNSFNRRGMQSIAVSSDDQFINDTADCHVYSLPYQFNKFLLMSNSFQRGRFDQVRFLLMTDDVRPFEHQLFQIISQDFPILQRLNILNDKPQKNEQYHSSSSVTFNHLFALDLMCIHPDYVIQFLTEKKTRLPSLTDLIVQYETLVTVTKNFTNDETRVNCAKIKSLVTYRQLVGTENFHLYFPSQYIV